MGEGEQTGPGSSGGGGVSAGIKAALAAAGLGALAFPLEIGCGAVLIIIFCGLGVLLLPLVILYLLFHGGGGGGSHGCPSSEVISAQVMPVAPTPHHGGCGGAGGTAMPTAVDTNPSDAITALQGDGKGDLAPGSVPADLRSPIEKAGKLCDGIGPVVIAAQIQYVSGFNTTMDGPDGKKGVSQLPPDKFKQFSQDDDKNNNVTPLDATDSIMAQGRYLCSLYGDVQQLVSSGQAQGDVLSMTLAAYGVGLDAVKQAKGVPNTNDGQGYVLGVRVYFSLFEGQGIGTTLPSVSALPTAS
ncbi:lysozyme family protein [Phaeacidiphilus oryzae]|uniref:lytic transglycosylase domain-containing protein n=1 Tax=Phaeacidiphilus oryzae TaxID=348818 RepID=UPI0006924355|nr:lytic transglycosylase domain-containing protein [Phaeacidiphilus oryzae]